MKPFPQSKIHYVKPFGDLSSARYIFVASQPLTADVLRNISFHSPEAEAFKRCLYSAGIAPHECYFTNLIKDCDRPIGFYIEPVYKNKVIVDYKIKEEGGQYIDILKEELSNAHSKVIIPLGDLPLWVISRRLGIHKWRSSVIPATLVDKTIIPTFDYTSISDPWQYKNKRLTIQDLKRAKLVVDGKWKPKKRNILIKPTYQQCLDFLNACKYCGLLGNIIWFDIEIDIFNKEMTCISFAYSPTNAISIPFISSNGDYFTPNQEIEILIRIAEILEDPNIPIGGQNMTFDCPYMLRKYGIVCSNIHDTMIAQKTLLPDYPMGLDFICSMHTDIPYYKEDGKYWLKGIGTWEQGWIYNGKDSIVCADAYPKQFSMLLHQQNYYTYERKRASLLPYIYMMERGIRVNLESMQVAYNNIRKDAEKHLSAIEKIAGQPLNPNSPKQLKEYFYGKLGHPAYKHKGSVSTNEKAMKRLSRKGVKEAALILKYRHDIKISSTYLDSRKVDPDSRMRSSYSPVGTRFARAASKETIFGTGNNMQNQPHHVLTHFEADPGYVFYGPDLGQAENRIVAYVGRIPQMIEAFETGQDVHSLTAFMMVNMFYGPKKAKTIDLKNDNAPIGDGSKCWRDWGKKSNHGLNYDLGYKTFALQNEITERDAKVLVNLYHSAYPGVRQGFHAYVKRCINKNRTLTNLMGRKTLFVDIIGDALFKGAYSCIPQGTVGDIIDQRGLNFIYYNKSPLFKNVELLIQVHDQVGFQIPTPYHPTNPVPWEDHCEILNQIKRSLETPLYTHYKRKFVIPADFMMGISLNKKLGKDLDSINPATLDAVYHEVKYDHEQRSYHFIKEGKQDGI